MWKNRKHHPEKSSVLLALYLSRLIGKSSLGKRQRGVRCQGLLQINENRSSDPDRIAPGPA
jgi:hypothetical protein